MKRIAILGSTGKIGTQALEVIRSYRNEFQVVGLACKHGNTAFKKQVAEFKPLMTAVSNQDGEKKLIEMATHPKVELVVMAVVGLAGLQPTLAALKAGKSVALATKEVLVVAGEMIIKELKLPKLLKKLIPVDSEHSAIFQSLANNPASAIKKIILTMGQGPITRMNQKQLDKVSLKDIFNRPKWDLGEKIAVDSATGINKAFEVIEAAYLFGLKPEQIEILVHPQYLCHSLVEFIDASILTELGVPDMKRYLQYALFYPERKPTKVSSFVELAGKSLTFAKPDYAKFPCLKLGFAALRAGGTMPAVLHGADRAAVEAFIEGKIKFTDIYPVIAETMKKHKVIKKPKLKDVIAAERWGYDNALNVIARSKATKQSQRRLPRSLCSLAMTS